MPPLFCSVSTPTPALPFCHFVLKAQEPKDCRYPSEIKSLGNRLKAKRMDLGLLQKDVAAIIGVNEDTICYWENDRVRPCSKLAVKAIQFLDHDLEI